MTFRHLTTGFPCIWKEAFVPTLIKHSWTTDSQAYYYCCTIEIKDIKDSIGDRPLSLKISERNQNAQRPLHCSERVKWSLNSPPFARFLTGVGVIGEEGHWRGEFIPAHATSWDIVCCLFGSGAGCKHCEHLPSWTLRCHLALFPGCSQTHVPHGLGPPAVAFSSWGSQMDLAEGLEAGPALFQPSLAWSSAFS